ncbi:polysaccharide biosynthesis/export family protein [Flavobacteriaceae bacterium XHP0103]|uniref:polysaccharide biosynthesis/export family protein n=1 Tax=Marixanthotalea marina TaxID=2844359 RepID=UPI002989A231|nr:polysaccharide biosynthesis/export family protein [Marixanthotalea marina]MBU3822277.1 polysaccharide biosynthesis/export family protein [Marixanthotalea marina]
MRKIYTIKKLLIGLILFNLILFTSCATREDVVYFQNAKSFETQVDTDTFESRFKVDDQVSIFVSTFDMEAVKPFNLVTGGGLNEQATSGTPINYTVDIEGNIDYPVLGKIKLLGLTIEEAKSLLKEKLSEYLKDPIINISVLNFEVTILGEVNAPGTYPVSGERISLLKAIGLAGDLTIKGKRDNVLVIRDFNGTKTYTRVDLRNKELFDSPVYFLTQNDVVYVEPNKSGASGATGDSRLGTILAISGLAVSIAILFTRF